MITSTLRSAIGHRSTAITSRVHLSGLSRSASSVQPIVVASAALQSTITRSYRCHDINTNHQTNAGVFTQHRSRRSFSSQSKPEALTLPPPQKDDDNKKIENISENPSSNSSSNSSSKKRPKRVIRPWDDSFRALKEFKEEHGHTKVSQESHPSLAAFVYQQKRKAHKLTAIQVDKLNSIGFDWETHSEKLEKLWQEKFQRLLDYQKEYGNTNVPRNYDEDPALGTWVDKQRYNASRGLLLDHRYEQLDQINDFQWYTATLTMDTKTHDKKWNRQYHKVAAFYRKHGHTLVARHGPDPSLGFWVAAQRGLYRKGLLREDRQERLEAIDFCFSMIEAHTGDIDADASAVEWQLMYEHLLDYQEEHGHVNVPQDYQPHGLGKWATMQKRYEMRGALEISRRERLQALGFQFSKTREARWEENYQHLQLFREKHGHCLVSTSSAADDEDNKNLAKWVARQRAAFRDGRMSKNRQSKLEELGFVWNAREAATEC